MVSRHALGAVPICNIHQSMLVGLLEKLTGRKQHETDERMTSHSRLRHTIALCFCGKRMPVTDSDGLAKNEMVLVMTPSIDGCH